MLKTLDHLSSRPSAKLLRHELQRQSLDRLADTPILELEAKCEELYKHPLAIRWFAWACGRDPSMWTKDASSLFLDKNIELFCVDNTLNTLPETARKVVSAIAALQDQIDVDAALVKQATALPADLLEKNLWDLECAGLVRSVTEELNGKCVYSVVPLAISAARELARRFRWEAPFVRACSAYMNANPEQSSDDPLLADLVRRSPREVRQMAPEEREALKVRIDRVKTKKMSPEAGLALLQLEAEYYRHSGNMLTARDLYSGAADRLLGSKLRLDKTRHQEILIEAATVLKQSGAVPANLKRAVKYLEAISSIATQDLRVFAMLAEMHALLGNEDRYHLFYDKARNKLDTEGTALSFHLRDLAESALSRAQDAYGGEDGA